MTISGEILKFSTNFDKFGSLWLEPRKTIVGKNVLDKFGVRGVFECCKGKKLDIFETRDRDPPTENFKNFKFFKDSLKNT